MTDEAAALCTGSDPGGVTQQPTQQSEPVHVKTVLQRLLCSS